jgi:hypothetical protein
MDLEEIECEYVDQVQVMEDESRSSYFKNIVLNLQVS